MRGKGLQCTLIIYSHRITPAYAGKRASLINAFMLNQDHPCVCGEKSTRACVSMPRAGSPLRMRGKELEFQRGMRAEGITPAYAGKRAAIQCQSWTDCDHPCVCGEKSGAKYLNHESSGSPLRMRGKGCM